MSASVRAGLASASVVMVGAAVLAWAALSADAEAGVRLRDLGAMTAIIGLPPAVAVGLLVRRSVPVAVGRDLPARLLAVATAGLRDRRRSWGMAMRAELAAIDVRGERVRFAFGCALTALRTGWTRSPLLVATAAGGVLAVITLVSSRMSLAGDRSGPLFGVVIGVMPLVLLAGAYAAAVARESFRAGLEYGFLALLAGLVGIVAVAVPEGAHWAETGGVFILDGDSPRGSLTASAGALDALRSTVVFGAIAWPAWPVIGARLGVSLRRRASPKGSRPVRRAVVR